MLFADEFDVEVSSIVRTVSAAVGQLEQSAGTMSTSADETSRQSTVVAAAAEQATSNVQTVASAAEELAASVREIGQQVAVAAEIASEASDQASGTAEIVRGLSASADRVVDRLVEPVEIEFVYSRSSAANYPGVQAHAGRVRELLREIEARAGDKLVLKEARSFKKKRSDNGRDVYVGATGKGQHDDTVIAEALCRLADYENPAHLRVSSEPDAEPQEKCPDYLSPAFAAEMHEASINGEPNPLEEWMDGWS